MVSVVPDGGCESEDAGEDSCGDAGGGAAVVAFEAELAFEGPVDRFDGLAQWAQELCAGSGGLGLNHAGFGRDCFCWVPAGSAGTC